MTKSNQAQVEDITNHIHAEQSEKAWLVWLVNHHRKADSLRLSMARHQVSRLSWLSDIINQLDYYNQLDGEVYDHTKSIVWWSKFSEVRCDIRQPRLLYRDQTPHPRAIMTTYRGFPRKSHSSNIWLNFELMTTDDIPGCKYIFSKLLEPNAGSPLPDRTRYNMTGNTITITTMMTTAM